MKSLKVFIPIAFILALCYINFHYEIFALNIPKGQGNEKPEGCFRVMTYNINAPMGSRDPEIIKEEIIEVVKEHNPDIMCLQELSTGIFEQIQVSLDSLFGYSDTMSVMKESHRCCLYSRKPIRKFSRYKCITEIDTTGFDDALQNEIRTIKREMPFYSAEIEVYPDRWITVLACHLRSSAYSTARRSMNESSTWSDGISMYLYNYKMGKKIRDYEADNLRIYLESLEAEDLPIIIAGDFNDWSGSYCLNTIRGGKYKDAWWEGGFGCGITYDEWHLKLRLDHIFYSRHFYLFKASVQDNLFSDHYPFTADFVLE